MQFVDEVYFNKVVSQFMKQYPEKKEDLETKEIWVEGITFKGQLIFGFGKSICDRRE